MSFARCTHSHVETITSRSVTRASIYLTHSFSLRVLPLLPISHLYAHHGRYYCCRNDATDGGDASIDAATGGSITTIAIRFAAVATTSRGIADTVSSDATGDAATAAAATAATATTDIIIQLLVIVILVLIEFARPTKVRATEVVQRQTVGIARRMDR